METVLVIGSNSFSGSDFVDLLLTERDYRVLGVSRSAEKHELFLPYKTNPNRDRFRFYQMDLNNDLPALVALITAERPAYIVNFAAQSEVAPSWANPGQWFQTNAVALADLTIRLKDMAFLKRYVHISTPEVYGTCEGVVREDAPLNPSTPYAASKAASDLMLLTLVKNFDFPVSTIRATNVYGAHQQLFKIIPRTVIYLQSGRTIELHGGGHAVKSYVHIRDVSVGELAVMERGRTGDIYHFSPDAGVAVRDVVRLICERLGKDFEASVKTVAERLGQDKAYVIDSTKARTELGWAPRVDMEQGLSAVAAWTRTYWDAIMAHPLDYIHKP